jgi:hypothetical protein
MCFPKLLRTLDLASADDCRIGLNGFAGLRDGRVSSSCGAFDLTVAGFGRSVMGLRLRSCDC